MHENKAFFHLIRAPEARAITRVSPKARRNASGALLRLGGRSIPVAGLRDAVRLRVAEDLERLASDFLQRLPSRTADDVGFYGAVLWPRSVLIAELLAQGPPLDGATVLCLGAGTGLEALVAALCGANALATDVYPFALSLVTEAAALNGVADRFSSTETLR